MPEHIILIYHYMLRFNYCLADLKSMKNGSFVIRLRRKELPSHQGHEFLLGPR